MRNTVKMHAALFNSNNQKIKSEAFEFICITHEPHCNHHCFLHLHLFVLILNTLKTRPLSPMLFQGTEPLLNAHFYYVATCLVPEGHCLIEVQLYMMLGNFQLSVCFSIFLRASLACFPAFPHQKPSVIYSTVCRLSCMSLIFKLAGKEFVHVQIVSGHCVHVVSVVLSYFGICLIIGIILLLFSGSQSC